MERRRRRLTLAPKFPVNLASASLTSPVDLGSRFACLASDISGSEIEEEDGIPFQVASSALEEESEEGWTPVACKKKTDAETAVDFWREIGFPTSASRFWECSRCSAGEVSSSRVFADVHGAGEVQVTPAASSPVVSPMRGAVSSPTGVRLSRVPRMGP
jgi:hypothetical protein